MIRLSLDATNIQREKIVFEMVKPYISGFSVEPMEVDATEEQSTPKRKVNEVASATADGETNGNPKAKGKKNKKSKK